MPFLHRVVAFIAVIVACAAVPSAASATTADEAAFLSKINALRVSKGVPELCLNPELEYVARAWGVQMAQRNTLAHNPSLAGQGPAGWEKLGENVGIGYDVNGLHQAFVNSPGHYANLVDRDFNQAGIGVIDSGGKKYVVEVFMKSPVLPPKTTAPAPAPKRSTAPPPVQPKPADSLSPKLRSFRSSVVVAK